MAWPHVLAQAWPEGLPACLWHATTSRTRRCTAAHPASPSPPASCAQHLAAPHIAFLRTLCNSVASNLAKGANAANATVHVLLSTSNPICPRAVAAYWVVSLCWVLCKRLAGIYAIS